MNLWLDCEWNDYLGELISIALVDDDGVQFYESLGCDYPTPWVAEHVMPVLGVTPILRSELRSKLVQYLGKYRTAHIIADWPEDIAHFCNLLITGPGERINTPPLTMEIRRDIDSSTSITPHNAIEDARAMRLTHMARDKADRLAYRKLGY